MRFFVIKQDTSLKSLAQKLSKADHGNTGAVERLAALNPHIDAARIATGTVLLVPDSDEFRTDDSDSVGDSFQDFSREVTAALGSVSGRVRQGLAERDERDKELGKVLKSAAIMKLTADDSALRKHVDETGDRIASDAKEAKQVMTRLADMEQGLAEELKKFESLTR